LKRWVGPPRPSSRAKANDPDETRLIDTFGALCDLAGTYLDTLSILGYLKDIQFQKHQHDRP